MLDSRRWTVAVLVVVLVVGPVAAAVPAAVQPAAALSPPATGSAGIELVFIDAGTENLTIVSPGGTTVDTGVGGSPGAIADFDGDSRQEVAVVNSNNNVVFVEDDGTTTTPGVSAFQVGGATDYDGDGDVDILTRGPNFGVTAVDASGNTDQFTSADPNDVGGFGDWDGDGTVEAAFIDPNGNLKTVEPGGTTTDLSVQAVQLSGFADWDSDGTTELVYTDSNNNIDAIEPSQSTTATGVSANFGTIGGLGDYDGDGTVEVAYRGASNTLALAESSGSTQTLSPTTFLIGGMGDIDGDSFTQQPTVDNSTAGPSGGVRVTSSPVTLEIDINDTEISAGDTVTVEFINNGQTVGTDTLTTNRTASVSTSTIQAGTNEWYVKASDVGNSQRSQNFTFKAPNEIQVRNASAPGQLVTGTSNEITVRFFDTGKDVIKKNTTTGTLSMTGLPVAPEGGYVVSVKDGSAFNDRRVIIDSLFRQQTVYLLPSGASSSEVEFEIDDRTGNFKQPKLFIERPFSRDFDGDGANETRYDRAFADDFDAAGSITAVLENEVRYRLRLRNADGDERVLGSITPTRARVVTLTVGELEFNPRQPQDRTFNATASTIETQNGTVSDVRFDYRDPTNETSKINVTVRTLNGTVLGSASTANGPFGDFSFTQPVQDPANETYVVEFNATRNGEVVSGQLRPGIAKLPVGIPLKDGLKSLFAVGLLLLVGGLFSASNARVGAVVTPLFAAGLWFIDWLPGAVSIFAVVIALAVGVLFNYARRSP